MFVHILLTILRIIGIILLVVIGLILLLVCLFLFVPLRYRGQLVREEGSGVPFEGKLTVTWLLRMLSVLVEMRGRSPVITLKVFGFRVKTFGSAAETHKKKKTKQAAGKRGNKEKAGKEEKESAEGKAAEEKKPVEKTAAEEKKSVERTAKEEKKPVEGKAGEEKKPVEKTDSGPGGKGKKPDMASKRNGLFRWLGKLQEFLFSVPQRLTDLYLLLYDLADDVSGKAEEAQEKFQKLSEKIRPFTEADARDWYGRVWIRIRKLIRHCRIRRIEGYLRYGTGAPDKTAYLTGLLYEVLPASAGRFDLQPLFLEKGFEADVIFRGHVRACHFVWTAIRLFLDRQTRKMIRLVRKKGRK